MRRKALVVLEALYWLYLLEMCVLVSEPQPKVPSLQAWLCCPGLLQSV